MAINLAEFGKMGFFAGLIQNDFANACLLSRRAICTRNAGRGSGAYLANEWNVQYIVFEGKQDLLRRLQMRIRGWQLPNSFFLVLCDQDAQDCKCLKSQIAMMLLATGKTTKIRIACHELENFYLGDLVAVAKGLSCSSVDRLASKSIYRQPDLIANAPDQLKRITGNAYQNCSGSRAIAPYLDLSGGNRSNSFNALLSAIRELTT